MKAFLFGLCLFSTLPARANMDAGWQAYKTGNYAQARDLFEADGSAEGYAAACRTGLVLGGFFEDSAASVNTLHRALDDCKAAIALDNSHVDARISYAIGLAFEGKRLKKAGYAKAARLLLEDLQVVADDYGIFHAAQGGWHASVYEAGFFARVALGAKRDIARAHFEKAVRLAPADIGVRLEFIKYLALGKKDEQQEALGQVASIAALPARDAFDAFLVMRAGRIGEMIAAHNDDGLKDALHAATAFDTVHAHKALPAYPLDDN